MAAFTNMSFETVGAAPGDASSWAWASGVSGGFKNALFSNALGGGSRIDGFEHGWGADTLISVLDDSNTVRLIFGAPTNPKNADGFEQNWTNDGFLFAFDAGIFAEFQNLPLPAVADPFDAFENGWDNDDFLYAFDSLLFEEALFNSDVDAFENFSSGWEFNEFFVFAFGPSDLANADDPVEDFESFKPDQVIAVTLPSTFNVANHGFVNGATVKFFPAIDGSAQLPTPLSSQLQYKVANATTNSFEVTAGGPSIIMSDPGAGTNYVRADPATTWGGKDGDTTGSDP